jgi:type I restriction enzyme S subunit
MLSKRTIDSLCLRVTSGGTPSRAVERYWSNGTIPWFKTGELKDGWLEDSEENITEEALSNSSAKVFPPNTVLMAMYGDGKTITSLGILRRSAATNQACCAMIANPHQCDYRFLFYKLKCVRAALLKLVVAGAQRNLSSGIIKGFQVEVPCLEIQSSIAETLSAYDDLIENNRRRITLLEEAARMLYREWFVRFRFPGHEHVKLIDGIPKGWERRTFDKVCNAIGGGTPSTGKPQFWNDGDIPWYTPTDITRNSCLALLGSEKEITEAGLRGSSAKMLPPGTVLMTSRASVGFFGIIDAPSCTNQGFISILPTDPRARMYLLHNLMHRVEEIRSHAGGATYKEISRGKFRALPVVMPEASLLREFEEQASEIHKQVRTLHMMNQKLGQARDLLLPRLMNGEIAV